MGELKKKTVNGVAWSAIERFSVRGVQFLLGIVIARLLNPSDYGLIAMLSVFMSISYVFIDGGFANALIQCKDRTEKDFSTVFFINLFMSVLFYLIMFFSAPLIAGFYNQPQLELITKVYMLNLIVNALVSINKVKVVINIDFKTLARITISAAFMSGILGVICAYIGWGVWALVVQMNSNAFFNLVLFVWYARWWPKLAFSKESFHKLFGFGSKLLLANLISKIYSNLYTLVIGKVFSPTVLGLYNRGHRFADFSSSNITLILKRVAFPVLSKLQDDNKKLLDAYSKYIKLSTFVIFPLMMGMCGAAKPFVLTVLTEKWAACIPIMQILSIAYMWNIVTTVNLNLLYVKGRSDLVLRLEIVKKVVAVVILLASIPFGIIGICLGRLLYSLMAVVFNSFYTKRLLNYGLVTQLREIFPSLVLSTFIACEGLMISAYVASPFLALVLCVVICSLSYFLMAKIIKHPCLNELMLILRRK